jgi:glycosyltransferase involved in cell wall biosynthesis
MPDRLRVAIVAPPWYPLPPDGYGGTEALVHLLSTELRRLGHDVTVFGAQGSAPGVEAVADAAWSEDLGGEWHGVRQAAYLARVYERLRGERFDVIHDHTGETGLLLAIHSGVAPVVVHTVHIEVVPQVAEFYRQVEDRVRLVAVSKAQAATAPGLRFCAVVHNAVEIPSAAPSRHHERYLVEVARITPGKGQDLAIEVARRTGRKLILAGKIERTRDGERYFEEQIEPHLGRHVEYYPNIAGAEKSHLLARAAAGLFPLRWSEPFGLAMAECMVLGTPVLALNSGSAPEVITPGVTGFVSEDLDQLVATVDLLEELDPQRCAAEARERFGPARMARDYLAVYAGEGRRRHREVPVDSAAAGRGR